MGVGAVGEAVRSPFGSTCRPYDLSMVLNDMAPIGAPAPNLRNRFLKRLEGSKTFASVRVTPDPKPPVLAGRTFDLVRHDGQLGPGSANGRASSSAISFN
jgi:hypothetical protein